ncbi:MAG: glycosyltransferase [Verrucomicrobia bacterium]|nr:glycosyltransferase [Verrucomicrobiota bacterium]
MSHFGILSFPGTGHLHPLTALGRALVRRGHQVTVFQVPDAERLVRAAGLGFWPIGKADFPLGTLRVQDQRLGRLQGMQALGFIFERFCRHSAVVLREAPGALRSAGVDGLVVDQAEFAGGTVAERLGLPFATAILTLPLNLDPRVPFCAFHAGPQPGPWARLRTQAGNARVGLLASGLRALINRQRQAWGLGPKANLDGFYSGLAQVAQVAAAFDFPQRHLAPHFHYAGPFLETGARRPVDFPWERLEPGRPLVFVSMGTLQNGMKRVFRAVAEACAAFPVQTVLSLGGNLAPEALGPLPGEPIVVRYAPQLELLRKSALTVFHGGLNTALESLSCGVPMVAVPVTMDQPGVGARVAWTGTGKAIPVARLSVERLRAAIAEVLGNPHYRIQAQRLQRQMALTPGAQRAAGLIEGALLNGLSEGPKGGLKVAKPEPLATWRPENRPAVPAAGTHACSGLTCCNLSGGCPPDER